MSSLHDDVRLDVERRNRRQEAALRRARLNSGRVRVLKFALPALAVLMLAAFAGFAALRELSIPDVAISQVSLSDGKVAMDNLRLRGVTSDDKPYEVEAVRALQPVNGTGPVELFDITATLPMDTGQTAALEAETGTYDQAGGTMTFDGGLRFQTEDGMVATLQNARIDLETSTLQTDAPVDIRRQTTHISAQSMMIEQGGKVLILERDVRVTLSPDALRNTSSLVEPSQPATIGTPQ